MAERERSGGEGGDEPLTDESILEMMQTDDLPRGAVVSDTMLSLKRFDLVKRALVEGIIAPDLRLDLQDNTIAHLAANWGSMDLLKYVIEEGGLHGNTINSTWRSGPV